MLLELVNANVIQTTTSTLISEEVNPIKRKDATALELIERSSPELQDIYGLLKAYVLALGDDVQYKPTYYYIAFKRIKNLLCVHAYPTKNQLICNLRLRSSECTLEEGYSRDVSNVGHWGTGNFEIIISSQKDLEKAKPFILAAYEEA